MAEKKSSGCLKAFVVTSVLCLLLTAVLGGGLFLLWKSKGEPSLAEWQAQLEDSNQANGGDADSEEGPSIVPIQRPVVASAPMQAGPEIYSRYVNRNDVLTLVNYYSDT